jgi:hypothetical protein
MPATDPGLLELQGVVSCKLEWLRVMEELRSIGSIVNDVYDSCILYDMNKPPEALGDALRDLERYVPTQAHAVHGSMHISGLTMDNQGASED